MQRLLVLLAFCLTLLQPSVGNADSKAKHFLVATVASAAVSTACSNTLKDKWGCWGLTFMSGVIAAAMWEAMQNDPSDMESDMLYGGLGMVTGSTIGILIEF